MCVASYQVSLTLLQPISTGYFVSILGECSSLYQINQFVAKTSIYQIITCKLVRIAKFSSQSEKYVTTFSSHQKVTLLKKTLEPTATTLHRYSSFRKMLRSAVDRLSKQKMPSTKIGSSLCYKVSSTNVCKHCQHAKPRKHCNSIFQGTLIITIPLQ